VQWRFTPSLNRRRNFPHWASIVTFIWVVVIFQPVNPS
jgi:hypothetical protein